MAQSAVLFHSEQVTRRRGIGKHPHPNVSPHHMEVLKTRRKRPAQHGWVVIIAAVAMGVVIVVLLLHLPKSAMRPPFISTTNFETTNHHHVIPNILIFTHRYNLLTLNVSSLPNSVTSAERQELQALQQNVYRVIDLHPGATVRFWTDEDCIQGLQRRTSQQDDSSASTLVDYFQKEPQGMFKADLCRGVALLETGGLYFDVDLGVRLNLWTVLQETTEFATVRVHMQSKHRGAFFQAFMASTPGHVVVERYVELFLEYYQGRLGEIPGPLGVILLKRAWDEILEQEQAATTSEKQEPSTVADPTTTALASIEKTAEIWQEVLYLPTLQETLLREISPPRWGTKRACKFIVIASREMPVIAPFYSRVAGSRMCPVVNRTVEQTSPYYYYYNDGEGNNNNNRQKEES